MLFLYLQLKLTNLTINTVMAIIILNSVRGNNIVASYLKRDTVGERYY